VPLMVGMAFMFCCFGGTLWLDHWEERSTGVPIGCYEFEKDGRYFAKRIRTGPTSNGVATIEISYETYLFCRRVDRIQTIVLVGGFGLAFVFVFVSRRVWR
jgi:hypothetical protein